MKHSGHGAHPGTYTWPRIIGVGITWGLITYGVLNVAASIIGAF